MSLLSLLLISLCVLSVYSASDCSSFGFEEELECATCEKLKLFTKDEDLFTVCKTCCKDKANEIQKAAAVRLTLGQYKERLYPHITEFIETHSSSFPSFTYQIDQFSHPTLELLDENGALVDMVRINHWETHDITEFLTKTLS